jgi:phosphate transport system substrate-binding protein
VPRLLILRSASLFFLTSSVAVVVIAAARAGEPSDPRTLSHARRPEKHLPDDRCEIAGSGSNLPLVRRLVSAYRVHHPADRIVLHDSVGSGGGVRAALDGVVHLGVISRPLKDEEKKAGLRAIPHVRAPVIFAANSSVTDRTLPMARFLDLVAGRTVRWSSGQPAVLLHRERGDSSNRVLMDLSPAFLRAYDAAAGHTHWRVLFHETEMVEALGETPGGVGLLDLGVLLLTDKPLTLVRIDGLDPTVADYPYMKELDFVVRGEPRGVTARLLEFVRTPEALAIERAAEYRPVME